MKPPSVLDCVTTPDGRELVLYQLGHAYLIQVDGHELMSSRVHGSEEAMAHLALRDFLRRPPDRQPPRVLIGGLGMGYTLRAALDCLEAWPEARVIVAEAFPAVVEWNRTALAGLAHRPLEDPRVQVEVGDVAVQLATPFPYDAILLDVDNGPEALTLDSNRELYTAAGLGRLYRALVPGGILAVWSAADDPGFAHRLHHRGFAVRTHCVPARSVPTNGGKKKAKGGRHYVFIARR